jgi:hypothetical protein
VEIDATQTGIRSDDDFVVEFWFSGAAQTTAATLFSVGDGINDVEPDKKLSIGINAGNKLVLRNNGVETVLSNNNYLDNTWRHFALNVLRDGSNIAYIDGEAIKQLTSTAVSNMAGDKITLGACKYNKPSGNGYVDTVVNYFTGAIDEVRVWRASLTGDAIRQNIYNQLEGSENGLVAYYPFNKQGYNAVFPTIVETQPTLENRAPLSGIRNGNNVAVDSLAVSNGATLAVTSAPTLKPARILENVAHTFTANNNKIILNITEAPSLIENTTLEIAVKNILDLNGNTSKDIRWTAYVHRNRLLWSEDNVSLSKEHLETTRFTVGISNQSGQAENWIITHLPAWLSASEISGTLQPLSSKTLTFTVAESTPTGSYEETIYLTGTQLIDAPLGISLKVTSQKPEWSLNPSDFEASMNLIGQLNIEGKISEDAEDIIAAFIADTCVGMASPVYDARYDVYFVMMDIYGKEGYAGKPVTFKIWDASTGTTYPVVTTPASVTVSFATGRLYGSMNTPIILTAENKVEQSISLSKGWTWISLNTQADDMSVSNAFKSVHGNTVLLKNTTLLAQPYGQGWSGSLSTVEVAKMYKINVSEASRLVLTGTPANPQQTPVNIKKDWSWIGYTPQFSLSLNDALADLNAEEGDVIKGQSQFAVYNGFAWTGSLQTMAPGRGYLYQSLAGTDKQFSYPSIPASVLRAGENPRQPERWTAVDESKYPGNMSVIAVVKNKGEQILDAEVGAFFSNECRGVQVTELERGLLFLSIAGDDNPASLTVKVYDRTAGKEYTLQTTIPLSIDAILGSVNNPYILQLDGTSGNEMLLDGNIRIYPTKVENVLYVESPADDIEAVIFHDLSGRVIHRIDNLSDRNTINVSGLAKGIYIVTVEKKTGKRIVVRIIK